MPTAMSASLHAHCSQLRHLHLTDPGWIIPPRSDKVGQLLWASTDYACIKKNKSILIVDTLHMVAVLIYLCAFQCSQQMCSYKLDWSKERCLLPILVLSWHVKRLLPLPSFSQPSSTRCWCQPPQSPDVAHLLATQPTGQQAGLLTNITNFEC